MASEQAKKLIQEVMAERKSQAQPQAQPQAQISSGLGNRGMPPPGALEYRLTTEPPSNFSWLRDVVFPGVIGLGGGMVTTAGARILGATAPRMLGAARLAGEMFGAAGAGALTRGPEGAATQGIGTLIGAGIGAGAARAVSRMKGLSALMQPSRLPIIGPRLQRATIAGATAADRLLAERGEGLLLSQAFDAPMIQNAERIFAESSPLGRGALGRAQRRASDTAKEMTETYARGIISRGSREEIGQAIETFLTNRYSVFQAASSHNYAEVDRLANGITVNIGPVQKEAAELMASGRIIGPGASSLLRDVLSREQNITFRQADKLRSSLLAIGREAEAMQPEQAEAFAKELAPIVEDSMEKAATSMQSVSPGLWKAFEKARSFHRKGVKPFNDEGIKAIMRRNPEAVAQYLIPQSGNFKVTSLRAIKEASKGDPEAMNALAGHYIHELFRNAGDDAAHTVARIGKPESARYISGEALLKRLNTDQEALGILLGESGRDRLIGLASAMARSEKVPGAKGQATLGTAVKYAMMGAVANGLVFKFGSPEMGAGTMATIIVGPRVINHMLASPTLRRWLISGGPPPTSRTASRMLGQVISHALAGQRRYGQDQVAILPPGEIEIPEETVRIPIEDLSALRR